jgi:hypothetical protein
MGQMLREMGDHMAEKEQPLGIRPFKNKKKRTTLDILDAALDVMEATAAKGNNKKYN